MAISVRKIGVFGGVIAGMALFAYAALVTVEPYYAWRAASILGTKPRDLSTAHHARHMQSVFARRLSQGLPADPLFLGASTVEGLDVRSFGENAMNVAVGGSTLADVRAGMTQKGAIPMSARTVVLLAGFNDLARGRSVADAVSDLDEIAGALTPQQQLIVMPVLPVDETKLENRRVNNEAIAAMNKAFGASCRAIVNCRFYAATIFDMPLDARFHTGDGLHLNGEGYRRLSHHVRMALQAGEAQ